ncbi:hypothetical protein EV138_3534 [Kribbella voronezhensis]|uniref:Uncharacterized protein n=1 Tax=Kribbella voronezhensis TaxID=2512212 RepID=A0A4V3FKE7_9ACTN|nr:hypothetical protein [Kribbella voronezhensis]TDU89953.1 hypothetical protein EV138_3534 [Kribbella voronezhensis]
MAAPQSRTHLYWACAVLSALTLLFLLAKVTGPATFNTLAWTGAALAALSTLALVTLYTACALGRAHLSTPVGRFTLFQLSVAPLVIALASAATLPDHYTGTLALLLPWGITYWLHNLPEKPADQ